MKIKLKPKEGDQSGLLSQKPSKKQKKQKRRRRKEKQ